MNFSTVLFDFDGTLTPSLELWLQAWQYALDYHNLMLEESIIIKQCFNRNYSDVADDFGIVSGISLEQQVQKGLEIAYLQARLFPQVVELLQSCGVANLTLGLVTSSFRNQVDTALAKFGIGQYFATVVTGNDVTHHKPHPEPVEIALHRLQKKPQETLFVGDNRVDVLAGKAAGTATALFLPQEHLRFYDFQMLRATEPDFVFSEYYQLFSYLGLSVNAP